MSGAEVEQGGARTRESPPSSIMKGLLCLTVTAFVLVAVVPVLLVLDALFAFGLMVGAAAALRRRGRP